MNQNNNNMESNSTITIESLIEQGNEIIQGISYVPSSPGVIRMFSVHRLSDESFFERWKNITMRFLSSRYPNDASVEDFRKAAEKFEGDYYHPTEMKKMIGVLESIAAIPTQINSTNYRHKKQPSIIINNTNSQSQNQAINIDLFTKAIEDVLTVSQIKELKKIVEEEKGDVVKAKPKLVDKLKSFGENLSSNIVANILTNPAIWSSIF